jgi:hypothetical protein
MTDAEVSKWTKALLLKIHVITGWVIPDDDPLYNILIDQFQKQLTEKYFELNPDEIEYAFRKAGTTIEDWGKSMNLNLMDKVLLPYLNDRYMISEVERQLAYKKTQPPFSLDNIDYRRMIEEDYQYFLSGKVFQTFPVHYYPTLVKDGFIIEETENYRILDMTDQEKDSLVLKVFESAKEQGIVNLYSK